MRKMKKKMKRRFHSNPSKFGEPISPLIASEWEDLTQRAIRKWETLDLSQIQSPTAKFYILYSSDPPRGRDSYLAAIEHLRTLQNHVQRSNFEKHLAITIFIVLALQWFSTGRSQMKQEEVSSP